MSDSSGIFRGPKPPLALGVLILIYGNKIYVKILNEIKINKFSIFHTKVYTKISLQIPGTDKT